LARQNSRAVFPLHYLAQEKFNFWKFNNPPSPLSNYIDCKRKPNLALGIREEVHV
jgi:hypothetical protein